MSPGISERQLKISAELSQFVRSPSRTLSIPSVTRNNATEPAETCRRKEDRYIENYTWSFRLSQWAMGNPLNSRNLRVSLYVFQQDGQGSFHVNTRQLQLHYYRRRRTVLQMSSICISTDAHCLLSM